MSSTNYILNYLSAESIKDLTEISLYRIYKGEFISEKALINMQSNKTARACKCARYDEEGKLTKMSSISPYEGSIQSSGGVDSVWFFKPNKRKAKNVLKNLYKSRIEELTERIKKHEEILKELK